MPGEALGWMEVKRAGFLHFQLRSLSSDCLRVQLKVEEKSCRNDEAGCDVGFVGWMSAA
jgi:hypothetical protein